MEHVTQLLGILLSALHIAGAGFALHALCRPHSPQGTIAWMLGLLLLPVITVPLYLLLGAARIHRHTTSRHSRDSIQAFLKAQGAWEPGGTRLNRTLSRSTGYAPCSGNSIRILQDGNDTYRDLLCALREARHSILVEFFIIRNDRVGSTLRNVLEEKSPGRVAGLRHLR